MGMGMEFPTTIGAEMGMEMEVAMGMEIEMEMVTAMGTGMVMVMVIEIGLSEKFTFESQRDVQLPKGTVFCGEMVVLSVCHFRARHVESRYNWLCIWRVHDQT